jgi:hypothetical protein
MNLPDKSLVADDRQERRMTSRRRHPAGAGESMGI